MAVNLLGKQWQVVNFPSLLSTNPPPGTGTVHLLDGIVVIAVSADGLAPAVLGHQQAQGWLQILTA